MLCVCGVLDLKESERERDVLKPWFKAKIEAPSKLLLLSLVFVVSLIL